MESTLTETLTSPAARDPHTNGLDPEGLAAAAGAIAADPRLGRVTFRTTTHWRGRLRSRTEVASYELAGERHVRRHVIESDEPTQLFGDGHAPNPQELLLAALSSCMMVGFVVGATKRGIALESLAVEAEVALDLRGAFGIDPSVSPGAERVRYTIRVHAPNARAAELEEIHAEVMATSPNRWHLTAPIPLEARLELV